MFNLKARKIIKIPTAVYFCEELLKAYYNNKHFLFILDYNPTQTWLMIVVFTAYKYAAHESYDSKALNKIVELSFQDLAVETYKAIEQIINTTAVYYNGIYQKPRGIIAKTNEHLYDYAEDDYYNMSAYIISGIHPKNIAYKNPGR
jgi:hypothetical protein